MLCAEHVAPGSLSLPGCAYTLMKKYTLICMFIQQRSQGWRRFACHLPEGSAPARGLAVDFDAWVERGQKARNALRILSKPLAEFSLEAQFFAPDETKQQNRFANEQDRKSDNTFETCLRRVSIENRRGTAGS
jgi:hypothetical protein